MKGKKAGILLVSGILLIFLVGCSKKKVYDGEITELPFGLEYGMLLDEVKTSLSEIEYKEEQKTSGVTVFTVTEGLNSRKYSKIMLYCYTYEPDNSLFSYLGIADKVSSPVTAFAKAEILLAEQQGKAQEVVPVFEEHYKESRRPSTEYMIDYTLEELIEEGDNRAEIADKLKEANEQPVLVAEQITISQQENGTLVTFSGNLIGWINAFTNIKNS